MTQSNINRMVNGRSNISVEVLNRITNTYKNTNLHWLLTGDGAMFLEEISQVKEEAAPYHSKGRLEELEERVEQIEREIRSLKKDIEK